MKGLTTLYVYEDKDMVPAQVTRRRDWFEEFVTRAITGAARKRVAKKLARVEKHLVQAEWELISMGLLRHKSDVEQVSLRKRIRSAQRGFLDYKRAVNLMTDEDHAQQALGLREATGD